MRYGYTRVSSTEQATDGRTSLADQERLIRGAAMMRGDESPRIFSDIDVSGSVPIGERPEGSKLIPLLVKGDELIIAKLDRAFRSASDALNNAERMQAQGISLILTDMGTEPVNNGNGPSKLFFTVMAAVAEFEKGRILERMRDGRNGKRARGGHIGGLAPYGWRIIGSGRTATLEEIEDEQRTIVLAREMHFEGISFRAISDRLQRTYGRASRSGKPFAAEQVRRMLESS